MYSKEKILEILEAYDLTSLRSAAALVGCDHHTVARYVAARAAGLDPSAAGSRPTVAEPFVSLAPRNTAPRPGPADLRRRRR